MVSTSQKICYPQQEHFLKTGFRLISIIVSTNRKKAPKSVSLRRKRLLFKNLISRTFHKQEECYFLKIGIFLISVMVSTSRSKSFKILFCLAKISFFYSEFFASLVETIIEAMWDPIFLKKLHYSQQKLVFKAVKTVFPPRGNIFFNEFFILASGNGFLSSGNSIPLFRALLKIQKFGTLFLLVETNFLASGSYFFPFTRSSCQ